MRTVVFYWFITTRTPLGVDSPHTERKFFGQPWGLANLFGIELWERFSFYGMQGLLAFYMYYATTEGGLGMDESTALSLVGAYGGFVYMMALVASFVSDRLLGPERTLYYSANLVMVGHILLALVPGPAGLALGLVCVGVGSGGVWGMAGFHWGFALAAIGMGIGLLQYTLMRKSSIGSAGSEVPNPLPRSEWAKWGVGAVAVIAVVVGLLAAGILPLDWLSWIVFAIALIATVTLLWEMFVSENVTPAEKSRLTGYIPLLVGSVAFFAIFQSQFTVVAVYSDQRADLSFFAWELNPTQVQSFNPAFIIIFAPIFAAT